MWSINLPSLGEYPDVSYEVGDFNRDGRPEIVALVDCSEVDLGPDYADVTRVLSAWDHQGQLLARKWIRGEGGTGLYPWPADQGDHWLMQDDQGLQRMRLAAAEEAAPADAASSDE